MLLYYSSVIYLKPKQSLYKIGNTDQFIYFILFGRLKLVNENKEKIGDTLNLGWTVGEEVLFENESRMRQERCIAQDECCLLGVLKKNLG